LATTFPKGRNKMKAVAIYPGVPDSLHLREVAKPTVDTVANGRGVLVKVLKVGLDGTDKEVIAGLYGKAPPGDDYLIIGHESFGVVEEIGPNVTELKVGDFVVATVRRPGQSIYDLIGMYDMSTDEEYHERGINLLHGFMAEYYVDEPEYIVRVPPGLKEVGVLLEPASVIEKGITQAYEIQRRMRVWRPRRAAVLGAGTIGLLATMSLRMRGLEVCTFARSKPPNRKSDLVDAIGGCYHSTQDITLAEASEDHGNFDLIFEATGYAPIVFEAMNVLAKDGVLVLSSVTGGGRTIEVPADSINLGFVLGNKVVVGTVNANREYFETGIKDMAQCEFQWSGWLSRLLTHGIDGLESYGEIVRLLTEARDAIKVFVKVA